MFHEFKNPMPVVTELGEGWIVYVRDGGAFCNDIFAVVLDKDGVIRHMRSDQFSICTNHTLGIKADHDDDSSHVDSGLVCGSDECCDCVAGVEAPEDPKGKLGTVADSVGKDVGWEDKGRRVHEEKAVGKKTRKMVFLICGYARAGKDTLADEIVEAFNGKCDKHSFADSLKEAATLSFKHLGIEMDFKDEKVKQKYRDVLVATAEAARNECPEVFAMNAAQRAAKSIAEGKNVVIPDWRYPNEHEVLETILPGRVIKVYVERDGNLPANATEEKTVGLVRDKVSFDFVVKARDGELEKLVEAAVMLASKPVSYKPPMMSNERHAELEHTGGPLTDEELKEGWHFCFDLDGMLIHPDDEDFNYCKCHGKRFSIGAPLC